MKQDYMLHFATSFRQYRRWTVMLHRQFPEGNLTHQNNDKKNMATKTSTEKGTGLSFAGHLTLYLVTNILLWGLWFAGTGDKFQVPWPVWSTMGWGLVVLFDFFGSAASRMHEK